MPRHTDAADSLILESPYDRLLSTAANRFHAMHLPAFPLAPLLVFWGGVQNGYWPFNMNPAEFAANVRCPTLLIHGSLDTRVTVDQARSVYDHLAGPKQFSLYEHAGHTSFLVSDPARWRREVAGFLGLHANAD